MSTSSPHRSVGTSWAARLLRGTACSLFGHPATVITILVAVWLLIHFMTGVHERAHLAEPWTWSEVLQCGGCLAALSIVVLIAVGQLVLTFISGIRKNNSKPDLSEQ
ncbi:MAG: hypothetical protein DHS20C16_31730 [Phycisphaerae bacterium]|nr:MAG: hypothetical protein DHS20C16_31730 [Phycisphaerae bacterium]